MLGLSYVSVPLYQIFCQPNQSSQPIVIDESGLQDTGHNNTKLMLTKLQAEKSAEQLPLSSSPSSLSTVVADGSEADAKNTIHGNNLKPITIYFEANATYP